MVNGERVHSASLDHANCFQTCILWTEHAECNRNGPFFFYLHYIHTSPQYISENILAAGVKFGHVTLTTNGNPFFSDRHPTH